MAPGKRFFGNSVISNILDLHFYLVLLACSSRLCTWVKTLTFSPSRDASLRCRTYFGCRVVFAKRRRIFSRGFPRIIDGLGTHGKYRHRRREGGIYHGETNVCTYMHRQVHRRRGLARGDSSGHFRTWLEELLVSCVRYTLGGRCARFPRFDLSPYILLQT